MGLMDRMSPTRAKNNKMWMKTKSIRYPFTHKQVTRRVIKPEDFEFVFPNIAFVRAPVHDAVFWMFEDAMDMDLFAAWEKSL
jgi:hypothetical protein